MSDELGIECQWLPRHTGSPIDQAFYADISLAVGEDWLTLLEEQNTVTRHLRACAHRLATWFAANWWRLRWEPETSSSANDINWRITHGMATAGGGYVWPNIIFASDGETLAVASRPHSKPAPFEPIRYLSQASKRITAAEFEQKVDAFMEKVLTRAHACGIRDDSLPGLWKEVLEERQDPEMIQWRKLEALCGYDPDEAPEEMIKFLIEDKAGLGGDALEEVAAKGRHSTQEVLQPILELAKSKAKPVGGGFRGTMPELNTARRKNPNDRPWQRAAKLAQLVRKDWNLGKNPVSNKQLADFLGTKATFFTSQIKAPTPMPIMLRSQTGDGFDFYVNSPWATTRRFAVSRLLGDYLDHANGERLIPATDAKTVRQQFQRAFAQEFLCPFDALLEKIQTVQPDEEDIAEAAQHFDVSPLMVRTTLVNKGELDREALNW